MRQELLQKPVYLALISEQGRVFKSGMRLASMNVKIEGKVIGPTRPVYVVAEMSSNHGGDLSRAIDIIYAAKEAGADAVKVQTYTAETMTLDSHLSHFFIKKGPWAGRTMYELYEAAYTPWNWYGQLAETAKTAGITLFSTPFDASAIDFLKQFDPPAFKVASPEIIELDLIKKLASTGKPLIISTGKATLGEIDTAVRVARNAGSDQIILLHCISEYPANPEDMNLKTISHLGKTFDVPSGLSDHSLCVSIPLAAVALGACMIEKHIMLDNSEISTPDTFFSLSASDFTEMVKGIREVEKAIGKVEYPRIADDSRRSIYAVTDIKQGEIFSDENIKSLRPGGGLQPSVLPTLVGRSATCDIARGTLIKWRHSGAMSLKEATG